MPKTTVLVEDGAVYTVASEVVKFALVFNLNVFAIYQPKAIAKLVAESVAVCSASEDSTKYLRFPEESLKYNFLSAVFIATSPATNVVPPLTGGVSPASLLLFS